MDFLDSAILGIVQGIAEFLPISSTGHLILVREWLGLATVGTLSFDAVLQLATGIAIVCYFWRDLWNIFLSIFDKTKSKTLLYSLIIATIPAIFFGLLLENYMDTVFRGSHVVAYALIAGAVLFYFAEKFARKTSENLSPLNGVPNRSERLPEVSIKQSIYIGLFQCIALIPGISRSGATISGGLFNGLSREAAARFSFLLSIPVILGSGLKKLVDVYQAPDFSSLEHSLFIASAFAFVSGILAIHFLLKFLKNHSLNYFGVYRVLLAIVILIWL